MLNISDNTINASVRTGDFKSFALLRKNRFRRLTILLLISLLITFFLSLFLPWTQNIQAKGYVTTRLPEQRPQSIQSVLAGQLVKWHVREGDFVEAGDTIAELSEVKSDYFDPELIARTSEQVMAKSQSIQSYEQKVQALQNQYDALGASLELKMKQTKNKIAQTRNKISMDSIDLIALRQNLDIADNQWLRTRELHARGLKSLSELQEKELKLQGAQAKLTVQDNKLVNQKSELDNLYLELSAVERDYADKLAKSRSDQQSARSDQLASIAATAKLQNQLSNYNQRRQFYWITAPQSGYITKTIKKGIGEIIKEGADLATIMPATYDLAVEAYLKPQDLPLMDIGQRLRLRFDGWPAIVISGWPESSTGVFSGHIVAIDQFIDNTGFYRIMVSPDDREKPWPRQLKVGTGAQSFILLRDVPIWYEIWRQLNGFPPDYYQTEQESKEQIKRKAPLKSVK